MILGNWALSLYWQYLNKSETVLILRIMILYISFPFGSKPCFGNKKTSTQLLRLTPPVPLVAGRPSRL